LNASVERGEFACQLYNIHVLVRDKDTIDTGAKIGQLKDRILKYDKEFPLKLFHIHTKGA
jgi:hypothetical protein